MKTARTAIAAGLLLAAAACEPAGTVEVPPKASLRVTGVEPLTWMRGTAITLRGETFLPDDRVQVTLSGDVDGSPLEATALFAVADGRTLEGYAEEQFFSAGEGTFAGELVVRASRSGQTIEGSASVQLRLAEHLSPFAARVSTMAAYFGDPIVIEGEDFLLEGEGAVEVVLDGRFTGDDGSLVDVAGFTSPATARDRNRLELQHRPALFGLQPGTFDGSVTAVNVHAWDGSRSASNAVAASITTLKPVVFDVVPREAGRGQYVRVQGGGFVEDPADGVTSLVRLHGTFSPRDGSPPVTLRAREVVGRIEPGVLKVVLAPRGDLSQIGGIPGTFQGTATVVVTRSGEELEGPPANLELTVLPAKQAVFLKYLPGFSDSLRKFGLRNVERETRDRILEVCRRDYAGIHIEFFEERPEYDFAEYSVLELTGEDPNGAGLFGLDNTEGKDDGNVRLDDVIGGRNAATEESGSYAFGGVFVESFLGLSPSLPEPNPLASARFDAVFAPFMIELGGRSVEVGEFPGGRRDGEIATAIHALGNLVGGTVVHEMGHSLGLAQVPFDPSAFHNPGDEPGLIMNPGGARTFEERAELDGLRARWADYDWEYLARVLPMP